MNGTVWLVFRQPQYVETRFSDNFSALLQLVQSLGVAIYRALDWGLDDSEERELSPQLERLIERMVGGESGDSTAGNGATDEGYSGQEEEEEEEEEQEQQGVVKPVCTFRQVMALCASRLANPSLAPEHYQAVCRALLVETLELQTFLIKIRDAKEVRYGVMRRARAENTRAERKVHEIYAWPVFTCVSGLKSASCGLHLAVCSLSEFELLISRPINIPVYTPPSREC